MEKKKTGYKLCGRRNIYVGDILALHYGFCGYFRVEERDNKYWLVNCDRDVIGWRPDQEIEPPFELKHHLSTHWVKVDPNNPRISSIEEFEEFVEEGEEDEVDPEQEEVEKYFLERYEKVSFKVMPRPYFSSKEEVDAWFKMMEDIHRIL